MSSSASLQAKLDVLRGQLEASGICKAELDAAQSRLTELAVVNNEHHTKRSDHYFGVFNFGRGAVGAMFCSELGPIGMAACFTLAGLGIFSGLKLADPEGVRAAEQKEEAAANALEQAIDQLAHCLNHS